MKMMLKCLKYHLLQELKRKRNDKGFKKTAAKYLKYVNSPFASHVEELCLRELSTAVWVATVALCVLTIIALLWEIPVLDF